MEGVILLLSIPVFYILGIVQVVSWFRKNKKKDLELLKEIENESRENPQKTLQQYYKELKNRFSDNTAIADEIAEDIIRTSENPEPEIHGPKNALQQDLGSLWNNWYSENSINLLLYLGAFLIVAAASIFVGFAWDTLSGTVKSIVLTLLTLAFFVSGMWFHSIPKIKNAGITFIGISALLIPICGTGWYNFVLKDSGVSGGAVWMITSFISLSLYAFLAYKFKNAFFTYTASLATISLALSFVNIAGLNKQLYILASLTGSFALLLLGLFSNTKSEQKNYMGLPLEISAHIIMPATLLYGLFSATLTNSLFSLEAAAGVFIAALFYLVTYISNKSLPSLIASQFLLPAGLFLLFRYLSIPDNYLLYTLDFVAMLYLYVAFLLRKDKKNDASDTNLLSSTVLTILVFIFSYAFGITQWEKYLFSLIPIGIGIGNAYVRRDIRFGYLSTVFLIFSTWILIIQTLNLSAFPHYFSHIMTSIGVLFLAVGIYKKDDKKIFDFAKISTLLFFIASIIAANIHYTTQSITFVIGSVLFLALYFAKREEKFISGFALLLNLSLFFFLISYKIKAPQEYFPISFSLLAMAFYFSSFIFKNQSEKLKNIGLISQLATTIGSVFLYATNNSYSYSYYSSHVKNTFLQISSLSTGYILTAIMAFDSYARRKKNMDYYASMAAMFTYIWQLFHLEVTQTLYYTIPIGVYFLILGNLRKMHQEKDNANILTFIGCTALIIPTFFLAQSQGSMYSITLAVIGIVMIAVGISIKNRTYQFSGSGGLILSILPQTFQYIMSLPKWLIVGIIGFVFVIVAIFLLLGKDDKKK